LVLGEGQPGARLGIARAAFRDRAQEGGFLEEALAEGIGRARKPLLARETADEVGGAAPGHGRHGGAKPVWIGITPGARDPGGERAIDGGWQAASRAEALSPVEQHALGIGRVQVLEIGSTQEEILQCLLRPGLETAKPGRNAASREGLVERQKAHGRSLSVPRA
jgi:hypothetical protein